MKANDAMRLSDVARYLGVTRQRVQQLAAEGHLPPPAGVDQRGRYWNREDLQEWAVVWAAARRWRRLSEVPLRRSESEQVDNA